MLRFLLQAQLWGYAPVGSSVYVNVTKDGYGWMNYLVEEVTSEDGSWMGKIEAGTEPQDQVGAGFRVEVTNTVPSTGDTTTLTLTDVAFGDVWFCSGQVSCDWSGGGVLTSDWSVQHGVAGEGCPERCGGAGAGGAVRGGAAAEDRAGGGHRASHGAAGIPHTVDQAHTCKRCLMMTMICSHYIN